MTAILQALLAWLPLLLSGDLKAPSFPDNPMVATPILLLLICATTSVLLVRRLRQRRHITGLSEPNTLHAKLNSGWKASGLRCSSKLTREHCLNKETPGRCPRLGLKLAVTMLFGIPCVLFLNGHFGHILASIGGHRAIERLPQNTRLIRQACKRCSKYTGRLHSPPKGSPAAILTLCSWIMCLLKATESLLLVREA